MAWPLYRYRAQTVHVVDGDTVDLDIDFGAYIHRTFRCRLLGINTPELHDPDELTRMEAERAKSALIEQTGMGATMLYIATERDHGDKYGRLLVTIYTAEDAEKSLNRQMVEWGLAVPYIGFERV
jgi:endonuclease YncB( thermonuclease family)